jgi:SAM-dependent methyltransferase
MQREFAGSGRGVQAPDGCSVELYRELPYMGELVPLAAYMSVGETVLELGCGTGRLTRALLEQGLQPCCIDNSPEMLANLPEGVRAIHADIKTLDLPEKFDVVLLASCLVNHPDEATRRAFINCAARHMHPSSRLLLQRHDPDWLRNVETGWKSNAGPIEIEVEKVSRELPEVTVALAYQLSGESWRQWFSAVPLDQQEIASLLAQESFAISVWCGPQLSWAVAALLDQP